MKPYSKWALLLSLIVAIALVSGACQASEETPTGPTQPSTQNIPPESVTNTPLPTLEVPPTPTASLRTYATQAPGQVKIVLWHNYDRDNMRVLMELIDKFNTTHPDIYVEQAFKIYDSYVQLLVTNINAGTQPDVATLDFILLPKIVATGGVAPLDEFIQADKFDMSDFYPLLAKFDVIDNKRYGVPYNTSNMQVIYNKDLFIKAGLDPEKPPKTWDEMQAMAEQCGKANDKVGFEFYTQPGEGLTWQFQVWLWAAGGEFLNADNTKAAFNSPEGVKALAYITNMLNGHGSRPSKPGLFESQQACMQLDGSWLFGYRLDSPFEWGIAPVPAPEGGTTASNVGGEHILIFKNTPHKKEAWEFVKFMTSRESQLFLDQATGFMPIRQSIGEDPTYLKWAQETEPRRLPFIQGMPYAHARPATPKYFEVSRVFSENIQLAMIGQKTPEEALAAAEKAVNDVLSAP